MFSCQMRTNCPCLWELSLQFRDFHQDLDTRIIAPVLQLQRDYCASCSLSTGNANFKLPCIHLIRSGSCSESRTHVNSVFGAVLFPASVLMLAQVPVSKLDTFIACLLDTFTVQCAWTCKPINLPDVYWFCVGLKRSDTKRSDHLSPNLS